MKLATASLTLAATTKRRRLEQMTAKDAVGTALRDLRLTLDATSRVTRVADLRPQVPAAESQTVAYTFDDRYRLTAAQDAVATTTWKLDDTAKILSIESGHQDAWLNVTNTYGENGAGPDQLTHHGTEALVHDQAGPRNQGWRADLRMGRQGPRQSRHTRLGGGEYVYAYDDERVIKQTTQDGTTTTVRYADPDVEERGGGVVRYVFVGDHVSLGSIRSTEPPQHPIALPRANGMRLCDRVRGVVELWVDACLWRWSVGSCSPCSG